MYLPAVLVRCVCVCVWSVYACVCVCVCWLGARTSLGALFTRYGRSPLFLQCAVNPGKLGCVLTHSSYWNYYNKVKQLQKEGSLDSEVKVDALLSPQVSEVKGHSGHWVSQVKGHSVRGSIRSLDQSGRVSQVEDQSVH